MLKLSSFENFFRLDGLIIKSFFYTLILFISLLSVIASLNYPGSKLLFLFFCLSVLIFLILSLFQRSFFSISFVGLFIFLGFWPKVILNQLFAISFVEPLGRFDFSGSSWDQVLNVITYGLWGLIGATIVALLAWPRHYQEGKTFLKTKFVFLSSIHLSVFFFALVAILCAMNLFFGIHRVGLMSQMIGPWPLNALVALILNLVATLTLAFLLRWAKKVNSSSSITHFILILFSILVTSTSILSRGQFVFQLLAFWLFIRFSYRQVFLNKKMISILSLVSVLFFFLNIYFTTYFRQAFYPSPNSAWSQRQKQLVQLEALDGSIANIKQKLVEQNKTTSFELEVHERERDELRAKLEKFLKEKENALNKSIAQPTQPLIFKDIPGNKNSGSAPMSSSLKTPLLMNSLFTFSKLLTGRFVGLEGVMAIQAFSGRSIDTLISYIAEEPNQFKPGRYENISNSNYQYSDRLVWQFSALPGLFAVLFLSDSLIFVFLSSLFFMIFLNLLEVALRKLFFEDLLAVSLVQVFLATNMVQLSFSVIFQFRYFLAVLLVCLFFAVVLRFVEYRKFS